jgi:hypothetical protein
LERLSKTTKTVSRGDEDLSILAPCYEMTVILSGEGGSSRRQGETNVLREAKHEIYPIFHIELLDITKSDSKGLKALAVTLQFQLLKLWRRPGF